MFHYQIIINLLKAIDCNGISNKIENKNSMDINK